MNLGLEPPLIILGHPTVTWKHLDVRAGYAPVTNLSLSNNSVRYFKPSC